MLRILLFFFFSLSLAHADTMEHYMNIYNNIPQMELKADPQSQAWARSARNIMVLTHESIAETLLQANEMAKKSGTALFCLPSSTELNATTLGELIQQAFKTLPGQQLDKTNMNISQVAALAVTQHYPCNRTQHAHASTPLANQRMDISNLLPH